MGEAIAAEKSKCEGALLPSYNNQVNLNYMHMREVAFSFAFNMFNLTNLHGCGLAWPSHMHILVVLRESI